MADATISTPLMNLQLPIPGVTPGTDWASILNAVAFLLDLHDHTPGRGALITVAGLNINATLSVNGNYITNVKSLQLKNLTGALSGSNDVTELQVIGGNLYYINAAGVAVQITNGTAVNNTVTGAISVSTPGAYPYTVSAGDAQHVLLIDTSVARTINLPAATTSVAFIIKDSVGSAGTNNITVVPNGTDAIEGVNANRLLQTNWGVWRLISDGVSRWFFW